MASVVEGVSSEMTLEFYRKALNYNVIGRYDPKIKQLLFHTPHASVYKWDFGKDEWVRLEYQGVLAIYLRDISQGDEFLQEETEEERSILALPSRPNGPEHNLEVLKGRDIYNYGLILLNRMNPENFSIGIAPNSVINKRRLFAPHEDSQQPLECMKVEVKDDLVIIKNLRHEVFGIWIHTVPDRKNVYELIKYLLENEPKSTFT
ncbi:LANO_0F00342g1_1 [Lachancea nothofagi CBS 11611]|uniref:LANO_0F00342g1_1 n=1 Tax=Lachancea nothofagi CBS 11611 TaxID=1266666 RepID=A0A1G4K5B6_9SACH|nr:LANO_0F00342g1_1 [Lachancea nothofagi CBS 11611]